eukprot:3251186-Rhodomonas_salina.1
MCLCCKGRVIGTAAHGRTRTRRKRRCNCWHGSACRGRRRIHQGHMRRHGTKQHAGAASRIALAAGSTMRDVSPGPHTAHDVSAEAVLTCFMTFSASSPGIPIHE